jgi:hypothetical protein
VELVRIKEQKPTPDQLKVLVAMRGGAELVICDFTCWLYRKKEVPNRQMEEVPPRVRAGLKRKTEGLAWFKAVSGSHGATYELTALGKYLADNGRATPADVERLSMEVLNV